ncbi:TolC family protein [Flavobacterium selenitireducens]|uniref:TolC family protein n=1 Tax=Flavobacterium selenitireducens TaxID=2722704 RepID=UPI00168AFD3F|nr:TolC family protein [Flavobacterium selenitireducens]MBD3581727.1 TolC family protein [Flavobacterium selenitireducens]
MFKIKITKWIVPMLAALAIASCKAPAITATADQLPMPETFAQNSDTANVSNLKWRDFFRDKHLQELIEVALRNNQELNITLQEIEISQNEIRMKKGGILPTIALKAGAGIEKVGRYTSQGAGDATTEIKPGVETPDPLADFGVKAVANWEVDIWKKLRNSKKAAVNRYLASVEGKNFVLTNLIAEVANSYYELLALDNQLAIVKQNIDIQKNGLEIVKVQKQAARATELAVQKFNAEVLSSQSLEFKISQEIVETENRINFLLGRYPQQIVRDTSDFVHIAPNFIAFGIPSQLLANRPDIKQAELELAAAKLDVKAARAEFYPSLDISASIGTQAFKPSYLATMPESLLYSIIGDLTAPIVNRNAIKAEFRSANSRQIQAAIQYQRTILNAYFEVSNQMSNIGNLQKSYELKLQQVQALTRSIEVSNDLFRSARADYLEVLLTQRDALESKLELVETKKAQFNAVVNVYRDLGGGWR